MDATISQAVARVVARQLIRMDGEALAEYLNELYAIGDAGSLSTSQVFVVEVAGGDFRQAAISSDPIRWWKVSSNEVVSIPYLDMTPFNKMCDAGGFLWPHPVVSFYADLPDVITCEGVGPATKCYRTLQLQQSANGLGVLRSEVVRRTNE